MSEFRFANLTWIHGIWIALLIAALLIALELRGRSILEQLVSRLMQQRLVHRTSLLRRVTTIVLATLSMILLIFALMRPQWGRTVERTMRIDSQIMVCLDVSKSMLAEDVAPNRLERAKVELDSLLGLMRDGQQVGLIAFAGKASVLCPMTTDFGFLRLVLGETDPESVGLGGTKIGTAVQKALDGFREAGDINRMILLITDGEDHDSFPLDAADRAKENGVRIVAVGFGDEAGSKIEVTDPRTGVRSFLKDRDGKEVTTYLDGETLREIALKTDGAYVPAGTGALDLESIYRKHIETMLHGSLDSQQRVIRNEAFQWFVLAAIILLFTALVSATPWNLRTRALMASGTLASQTPGIGGAILLAVAASVTPALAQQPPSANKSAAPPAKTQTAELGDQPPAATNQASGDGAADTTDDPIDETLPPRTIYNLALAALGSDPDRAERLLNHARREAGADGELRFRTLYNLGWVEVNRADDKLQAEPQVALQHLHQAANRFREAIRVRPDSNEARQNLELVSRRILELTDALRKKDPSDLAARLDELIAQTRQHQSELQSIVQQINREGSAAIDSFRTSFRALAVTQRQMISDTQQFSDDACAEMDSLVKKPDKEKTPEDKIRAVQLQNMLSFIDSGVQRMNKSRSLTRRLQGDGSFRRWSSALSDLKRARDQLRNPVEVLGQIIGDATETANLSQMLAVGKLRLPGDDAAAQIPAWVTKDFVADSVGAITDRIAELEQVFTNISSAQKNKDDSDEPPESEPADPRTELLLKNIETATPIVCEAKSLYVRSGTELGSDAFDVARQSQMEGLAELTKAWELFFDIRRLIELIYEHQKLAQSVIVQAKDQPGSIAQLKEPLARTQVTNLQRCERLAGLLVLEKDQSPADSAEAGAAPQPDPKAQQPGTGNEQDEAQRQRLERAAELLDKVIAEIQQADSLLSDDPPAMAEMPDPKAEADRAAEPGAIDPDAARAESGDDIESSASDDKPFQEAGAAVDRSIESLEELRRLFFSIVEHLRDTARRQTDLNDETTELAAEEESVERPEKTGPMAMRQQQLQSIAEQIAGALRQQGEQAAAAADQQANAPPDQGPGSPDPAAAAEKLLQAADLVDDAQKTMLDASEQLLAIAQGNAAPSEPFAATQETQKESLEKLLEALALLQDDDQQDQQQQNQQNQDQQQQDEENQKQQQQQQQMDANQLLQLIRDREAERRKNKKQRAAASGTVDKDW